MFKKLSKSALAFVLVAVMLICALPVYASSYIDVPPEMNNTYPTVIAKREGSFWGSGEFIGNQKIAMGWHQYTYLNPDSSVVDTTKAKYMEFDVWSNAEVKNTMNFWLSCNVWNESGRALFTFPKLNKGWNHVVIDLSKVINYANFGAVSYNRANIMCFFLAGTPLTDENVELDFEFANWAFTTDSEGSPKMNNTHPYSVFEKSGLIYDWSRTAGETMNWRDYFYIDGGNNIDISKAQYLEFDLESNVDHNGFYFWISTAGGDMPARKLYEGGNLKKGLNHIVIDLSKHINRYATADSPWSDTLVKSMLLSKITLTQNYNFKFYNFAFTTDTNPNPNSEPTTESVENVPETDYASRDLIATRNIDLKGAKNNTTDERYFDWSVYGNAFIDMISNPLDITQAKYIEFDYYSDKAETVSLSLGSLHEANGFQFYDNRSNRKSFDVEVGWNHIVLSTDSAFRTADTSTLKSYNPKKVTGFVLHGATSSYVRLTNVALIGSSFINDPILNYRDDFDWGSVMHAPQWGLPYRADNLELQIKQLAEMGGTLLRVDAVNNWSHLDKTVKLCNAYGIKVMLVVSIPGRTYDPSVSVDLDAIKKHFRKYATRYDGNHGCGKADYIQIDNEMDVSLMGWTGVETHGKEIANYDAKALAHITKQVKAASEGVAEAGTDIKRIINIAWVHYGILKYFYQNGVEWDITGHDWYQDMFGYGGNAEEFYGSGQELYNLFKKPIIICETNMWMNAYYKEGVEPPNYQLSSWWDPLAQALKNYYEKDYVIGCTIYEFYDEPMHNSGEGHFGLNEVNTDGSFKAHKPMYYRAQYMFGGKAVEQKVWHEVDEEYAALGEYDMATLVRVKNVLLNNKDEYNADYDFIIDGKVLVEDFVVLRKLLFKNF